MRERIEGKQSSSMEMALTALPVREVTVAAVAEDTVCASGMDDGRLVSNGWS